MANASEEELRGQSKDHLHPEVMWQYYGLFWAVPGQALLFHQPEYLKESFSDSGVVLVHIPNLPVALWLRGCLTWGLLGHQWHGRLGHFACLEACRCLCSAFSSCSLSSAPSAASLFVHFTAACSGDILMWAVPRTLFCLLTAPTEVERHLSSLHQCGFVFSEKTAIIWAFC